MQNIVRCSCQSSHNNANDKLFTFSNERLSSTSKLNLNAKDRNIYGSSLKRKVSICVENKMCFEGCFKLNLRLFVWERESGRPRLCCFEEKLC